MANDTKHNYIAIANELLSTVRERLCIPCAEGGENLKKVDLENPLQCDCVCEKVEVMLTAAKGIIADSDND
ncbi:hypothetical protein BEN30_08735 [Magnetovibrio blakemorei]|uniref:Uncharacterized protein n=1 Tax=Magnetovibrio blakemorei TaxID=28181 RepID=A0A1E5Q8D8_9PROT|nr:hypothetical protein BEN30_08735 [Magnetovibrio blakemorei]